MMLRRLLPSFCALAALCMTTAALAGPVGVTDVPQTPPIKLQDSAELEGLALPGGIGGTSVVPTSVDAAASATRSARQARLAAFIAEREARAAARAAVDGGVANRAGPESRQGTAPATRADSSSLFESSAAELERSDAAAKEKAGRVPERVTYSGPSGDGRSNYDSGGGSQRGLVDAMSPQQRDFAREAINYVRGLLTDPLTWFLLIPVGLGVAALAVMVRRG